MYIDNSGIIARSSNLPKETWLDNKDQSIAIDNYIVDTAEIYHVYRTVLTLDNDPSIDVIILFDDIQVHVDKKGSDEVFVTKNKPLIRWFIKDRDTQKTQYPNNKILDCDKKCDEMDSIYCRKDQSIQIQQHSHTSLSSIIPEAVLLPIISLSWKHVIIFYETSSEFDTTMLVDLLSKKGILFAMFNIEYVRNLHQLLHDLYDKRVNTEPINNDMNIIVVCKIYYATFILNTANNFDHKNSGKKTLLKKFSRWFIVGYNFCRCTFNTLKYSAKDLDNVAIIAIPTETRTAQGFYEILRDIVYDVNRLRQTDESLNFTSTIIERLQQTTKNTCTGYIIDTLLWTQSGRGFNSVGYVTIDGNIVLESDIFPNINYGYNMREFLVSTLPYPPFVIKNIDNGTALYEGFCIDLLKELSRILNFTYFIMEPPDGYWGDYDSEDNFTFNGLVGQLQRKEIDITAAPLSEQPERHQVMDFSYPFFYEYTTVVVKKPDPLASKWRRLLDPFKWQVLISIGGVHLPYSVSGRTLVSFWWLFCIIIVGTYCGNLIAFLTVTKETPPFNTLAEMVELKNSYKWGTLGATGWEMILRTSTNPTFRAVGDSMIEFSKSDPDILNTSVDAQIEKVMKGNYAWIGDKTSIELAMVEECALTTTKEMFMPMSYAFGFINNSPHAPVFSQHMMKIHEGGLLQIWKQKWWPKANFCSGNIVTESKPFSLEDVQSAFYVCCVGILVGVMVLTIEIIVHKCKYRIGNFNIT
ncbi:hypothetical protein ACF0H5_020245 [Mactra antiquata]